MEKALEQRIVGAVVAGKYRIRRVMAEGSMGLVCEAEHVEIGKRFAVKVIDASVAATSGVAMRFRQEARAASLVESDHIVQVFDVGTDETLGLYLVMEYLTGEDLGWVLKRDKRLSVDMAIRIAVQVARGLRKAHDAGVVHRDLKPANIFLAERDDDEPLVKILDFGVSKIIDASRSESGVRLTRAGTIVGTPQYTSPEQAQGHAIDARTDVWALGLVLYEMLAGRPAYPELPTYEAFVAHLVSHPPDPLCEVAPGVPAALADIVHQAIERDLAKRIPSCVELAKRLLASHRPSAPRAPTLTLAERVVPMAFAPAPRAHTAPVASSGVHASVEQAWDDEPDDAPQFFDRESMDRALLAQAHDRSQAQQARPPRGDLRWIALLALALGLVFVAALALRR